METITCVDELAALGARMPLQDLARSRRGAAVGLYANQSAVCLHTFKWDRHTVCCYCKTMIWQ